MGEATKTTTRFIEHVVSKNNTARLIELKTLVGNLHSKKDELEKIIDAGTITGDELKQKILDFNKIVDQINNAKIEQSSLTKKTIDTKPIAKKEFINITTVEQVRLEEKNQLPINAVTSSIDIPALTEIPKTEENILVPDNKPEEKIISIKNSNDGRLVQLGSELRNLIIKKEGLERYIKNNNLSGKALEEKITEYNNIINQIESGRLEQKELGGKNLNYEPLIKMGIPGEKLPEEENAPKNEPGAAAVVPTVESVQVEAALVSDDNFMKQLAEQMEIMLEIDRKIEEIKQENIELENLIVEIEKQEGEEMLKEKAIQVIQAAKNKNIKRNDPSLVQHFSKELIDEVYNSKVAKKTKTKKVEPVLEEVLPAPVAEIVAEEEPVVNEVAEEIPVVIQENSKVIENKEVVKTMFAKFPEIDGKTLESVGMISEQNGEFVYEIQEHADNTATITLSDNAGAQQYALSDFRRYFAGFEMTNEPQNPSYLPKLLEKGEAKKQGKDWIITKKPRIKFISRGA